MAYLYRHIRLDKNKPFYIGIGEDNILNEGKFLRAYSKYCHNIHWNNITNLTQYDIEIVLDNLTWEEACQKEIELIKLYGRSDLGLGPLCNMTDGGEGANHFSPESLEKRGKNHSLTLQNNPEINIQRGKNVSKNWQNKNIKEKQIIGNKITNSKKGMEYPTLWREVIQMDLQNNIIKEFPSVKHIELETGINKKSITICCLGGSKTCKGFKWKYKYDNSRNI